MLRYIETRSNNPGTRNTFFCEYEGTLEVYGLEVDIVAEKWDIVDEDGESLGFDKSTRNFHRKNILECLGKL